MTEIQKKVLQEACRIVEQSRLLLHNASPILANQIYLDLNAVASELVTAFPTPPLGNILKLSEQSRF